MSSEDRDGRRSLFKRPLPPPFWLIVGLEYDWMGRVYFVYRDHWGKGHTPIMPKGKGLTVFLHWFHAQEKMCRRSFFLLPPQKQTTQPTTLSIYYAHVYYGEVLFGLWPERRLKNSQSCLFWCSHFPSFSLTLPFVTSASASAGTRC